MRLILANLAMLACFLLFLGAFNVFADAPDKITPPIEPDKSPEAVKRATLWKALLEKCRSEKRDIRIYAESPSLAYVCVYFVNDDLPYIYDAAKNEIRAASLSHAINKGTNHITYEERDKKGIFVLWYYGQRDGIVDPAKIASR